MDSGGASFRELLARANALAVAPGLRVLGICGSPASGKSTLSDRLRRAMGGRAVVVGMDGFHLAQHELERLGIAERKGAPDTFDAHGYLALLRRLRDAGGHTVYAPEFRRAIEEPVAGAVAIVPGTPLVITEGNYLLLGESPWDGLRPLLDEVWFLRPDDESRVARLVARHETFGRTRMEAMERAYGSDASNAAVIAATAERADLILDGDVLGTDGG